MRTRGVALISVMIVLLLASLAVLTGARMGLLQEMTTGSHADQARAHAEAQALLLDAEADILGVRADGSPCRPSAMDATRSETGHVGCRERGVDILPAAPYFPQSLDEFDEVRALLQAGPGLPCRAGMCAPSTLGSATVLEDADAAALGARHGQFTQASDAHASRATGRGRYWVEMFRYQADAGGETALHAAQPDPARPFVYRITAIAYGLKPGTRAVVQSLFVPYPSAQFP